MYNNTHNGLPMCDDHGDYCPQDCPKREAHERAKADVLNRAEIEERERGMNLAILEVTLERLGIDKKLEELKPDLEKCRWLRDRLVDQLSHSEPTIYGAELHGCMESLKKVIEFIECIDEP